MGLATEWWMSILSAGNDAWLGKEGMCSDGGEQVTRDGV